jgi:hypothetical protein
MCKKPPECAGLIVEVGGCEGGATALPSILVGGRQLLPGRKRIIASLSFTIVVQLFDRADLHSGRLF